MAEAPLQLADGLSAVPVELREYVRLRLGDTQVSCRPLDMNRDEVDSAFQFCDHSHIGYYDMDMTDDELIRSFEAGSIRAADFPHEAHIRVTRLLIDLYGRDLAYGRLLAGIKGIAERAGSSQAFHETVTRAWFELIASADDPALQPELLDRGLLNRYCSREALAAGRDCWVEPDLHALVLPPRRSPVRSISSA